MIYTTVRLWPEYPDATLTTYVCDDPDELKMPPRRAMIVCPGGGYQFLSERESEPAVKLYLAAGMNVFLLRYTVKEQAKDYAPLIQGCLAVKYVREHAKEYNVDPNYVFITGFSAGGHLAASTGTLWRIPEVQRQMDGAPRDICRPTGMVLCYPVLIYSHAGTFRNLCGTKDPTREQTEKYELERYVTEDTPPAFLWHTFSDRGVDVQNSLTFAQKLKDNGVPFELHIFPEGCHGLSLANKETWCMREELLVPHAAAWAELAVKWVTDFKAPMKGM